MYVPLLGSVYVCSLVLKITFVVWDKLVFKNQQRHILKVGGNVASDNFDFESNHEKIQRGQI